MMPVKWQRTFQFWAKTEEYKNRIQEAKIKIARALEYFERPFVSFSGGKDSTVMLHLVLQQAPDVMVFHWDYGRFFMPREIEAEIIENAKKIGARNIRVETSELYEKYGRNARNILGKILIRHWMPMLRREGYDCCFLGLREEESSRRRRRIHRAGPAEYLGCRVVPANVFPISHLTWLDVWAYIISNNLPYLSFYDKYAELLGYNCARLVTFFDMEFEKIGAPYIDGFLLPEKRHII